MTSPIPYWRFAELKLLYLEDSYVLGIEEEAGTLTFVMDFVVREQHPEYRPPTGDQQYCYRRGELSFDPAEDITWIERSDAFATDATGEVDYGNIDWLEYNDGAFRLGGEWGEVHVRAAPPTVTLQGQ